MRKIILLLPTGLIFSLVILVACSSTTSVEKTNVKTAAGKELTSANNEKKSSENQSIEINSQPLKNASPVEKKRSVKTEFSEAKGSGTGELGIFAKWNFSSGSDNYEITNQGKGNKKGEKSELVFSLSIEKDLQITRIYFAEYQNDLIILSEVSDSESGGGIVECFGKSTLKPKWQAEINSFNVEKGIIEDQFAYLNAMGFVAKLDLETGKYAWKYDDLYIKHNKQFNSFDFTSIEGEDVIFTEEITGHVTNKIRINKNSGKIIKVTLAQEEK